jgi:hypothetical protein
VIDEIKMVLMYKPEVFPDVSSVYISRVLLVSEEKKRSLFHNDAMPTRNGELVVRCRVPNVPHR